MNVVAKDVKLIEMQIIPNQPVQDIKTATLENFAQIIQVCVSQPNSRCKIDSDCPRNYECRARRCRVERDKDFK